MPSTLPQPHFSIRDPTPPLTHNVQRQALLPPWANKLLDTTSSGSMSWPVPLRDGLPTPPGDMTGVAYNTTTTSDHVGKSCGLPVSKYTGLSSMSQTNFDSRSSVQVPASNKVRSQAPSSKEGSASESTSEQKKSSNGSIASYLQIPSSINDSKGSLAEFAAQVRI